MGGWVSGEGGWWHAPKLQKRAAWVGGRDGVEYEQNNNPNWDNPPPTLPTTPYRAPPLQMRRTSPRSARPSTTRTWRRWRPTWTHSSWAASRCCRAWRRWSPWWVGVVGGVGAKLVGWEGGWVCGCEGEALFVAGAHGLVPPGSLCCTRCSDLTTRGMRLASWGSDGPFRLPSSSCFGCRPWSRPPLGVHPAHPCAPQLCLPAVSG